STLPVLAQDFTAPDVAIAAIAEHLLALHAGLAVSRLLQRALRGFVFHERTRADLVQVQLAKTERGAQDHRLGRDPLAPVRFVADGETRLAIPVPPADPSDSGEADRFAVDLD